MSSANEHLPPPPKPRMSPLDFRNTDLVSRLLAATPPYLYNMSLLPNTYFFSEMLRSFVQAKTDPAARQLPGGTMHPRRTRKRPWGSSRTASSTEHFHKTATPPKTDSTTDWLLKTPYQEQKLDSPLELTTTDRNSSSSSEIIEKTAEAEQKSQQQVKSVFDSAGLSDRKTTTDIAMHEASSASVFSQEGPPALILPPPPPIWYPPLYPTAPYGIDPLHFFIDLRVSGHIYDRKGNNETESKPQEQQLIARDPFKQSRHASAFSVPVPGHHKSAQDEGTSESSRSHRFDVKSMGFDKKTNRTGTSYIMCNINDIYKNVLAQQHNVKTEDIAGETDSETEEQRQKRMKDLRALIGLELVVDYMNHAKPQVRRPTDECSSTDVESVDSPALEVVALPENET